MGTTHDQGKHRAAHAAPAHGTPRRQATRRSQAPAAGRLASESTSIDTIRTGQGARVTTRKNAAEAAGRARKSAEQRYFSRHPEARAQGGPERSVGKIVLLVVAAFLALALVFVIGTLVTSLIFPPQAQEGTGGQELHLTESELAMREQQEAHDAGQEVAGTDGSVSCGGVTYALAQQEDGGWAVTGTVNGSTDTIFTIEGTPVALARSADLLLVVENRDGGWDVVCYMINGHADATLLVGADGQPWGGSGDAASAELSGSTIRVTDASGATSETAFE